MALSFCILFSYKSRFSCVVSKRETSFPFKINYKFFCHQRKQGEMDLQFMRRTPPSEPSPSSPLMPASLASREAAPETAPPPPPPPPRPRLRFRRRLDRLIVSAGKAPPPSAPRHVPHSRAIVPLKSPIWQCSVAVVE